jgi:hypothetical protein
VRSAGQVRVMADGAPVAARIRQEATDGWNDDRGQERQVAVFDEAVQKPANR